MDNEIGDADASFMAERERENGGRGRQPHHYSLTTKLFRARLVVKKERKKERMKKNCVSLRYAIREGPEGLKTALRACRSGPELLGIVSGLSLVISGSRVSLDLLKGPERMASRFFSGVLLSQIMVSGSFEGTFGGRGRSRVLLERPQWPEVLRTSRGT